MKVSYLKTLSLFVISIILINVSCQKQVEHTSQTDSISLDSMVSHAQTWFTNGPVMREKKMLNLPFSILPEMSSQRFFARMSKLQAKLKWGNAALYNKEGIEYLVVPVEKGIKPFSKDFEIAKSVVFYIMKSGEMKMNVIEVLSKEGGSLQNKSKEIMSTAFFNMIKNAKDPVPGINADVFFYNDSHQSVRSFEIKNGVWRDSKNSLRITQINGEFTESSLENKTETYGCETWYVIYSHFEDGELIYWIILSTYQVGDGCGSSNGDETEDPYGGSGDGSGGTSNFENTISHFKSNYEISSVSELESSELLSETPESRTKKYPWICGRASLIVVKSLEYGTHKKVNNEWQWDTLTHQTVSVVGPVIGGSVSVTSHSGLAEIGTYNAGMEVDYTLYYSVVIPYFSPVNWSVDLSKRAVWHVNY